MMDRIKLREDIQGPNVVMPTPFKSGTEIDEAAVRWHTGFLVDEGLTRGTAVLIPNGSGSESYSMRLAERKRVAEIVLEEANGRVPVVVGCNETGTDMVIELAKHAAENGAEAIMLMPPMFFTPSDEVIFRHYVAVAEAADLGIMLYNNEHVVRKDLSFDLMARLAEIPHIVAIKECSPSLRRMQRLVDDFGDRWNILSGMAEFYHPFDYQIGAVGYTCGIPNFAPHIGVAMHEAGKRGDLARSMELRDRVLPMIEAMVTISEGPSSKVPMKLLGMPVGDFTRLPSLAPTEEQVSHIRRAMIHMGLKPVA